MKRLSHHLLIAALALALAACAGAPAPTTEADVPPTSAAKTSFSAVAAPEPVPVPEPSSVPQPIAPVQPAERSSFAVEEEDVAAPTIEVDVRALIAQGRQALERGQKSEGVALLVSALSQLEPADPHGIEKLEAAELLAALYVDEGRFAEAIELLTGLRQPLNTCLLRSLALATEIEGRNIDTVYAYLQLMGLVDEMERDELNRRIGYLMDKLKEDELAALSEDQLFSRIGGYAALRLARLRIAQKRPEEAEPLLWRLQFLFGGDPIGHSADALVRRLVAARTQKPGHFGVMLPLSGKLSLFGQRVLRGILLASDLLSAAPGTAEAEQGTIGTIGTTGTTGIAGTEGTEEIETPAPQQALTLHIFDTRADPENARRGVIELADKGVIGIIGPLKGSVAQAAAEEARALGVPLLTPTPTAEVEGDGVFRLGLRPEDEIDRLARYAIEEAGIKRFAILAPDTTKGRSYRNIFWDSVVRYGGEIAGATLFEPGKNISLKEPIAKLTGIHKLSKAEHRERFDEMRLEELAEITSLLMELGISARGAVETMALDEEEEFAQYEPKPRVDFTGVFLPIGSKDAALLAPQLPYHDVFGTTLLGLRSWNHPTLVEVGREYVNGALVPVEWSAATPEGQAFADAYKEAYRRDPGVLEVYGFDAGTLALSASLKGAAVSRDEFRHLLARLWAQQAVTGPLTTHPSGVIASEPKILIVKRGRFIPAPTSEGN
jgi:ABC-type branched-subunit amino acid transport system substrate-binding protein